MEKNATETYGMLQTAFQPSCMNRASVFEWYKRFKEGRESVRDDERWGRSKKVNTPELTGQRVRLRVSNLQSSLLRGGTRPNELGTQWEGLGLGLELLCWGFKGVQEEILSEEASSFQIGSVAFPPGQYTSPQLYPCHRLFDQDGHQNSSSSSI